jgi:hypothetical protein
MSDHVDGPRSIGEPAADITDSFAFTSPENPEHTVLAMCVFPYAGENAIFSNVGRLRTDTPCECSRARSPLDVGGFGPSLSRRAVLVFGWAPLALALLASLPEEIFTHHRRHLPRLRSELCLP